MLETADRCFVCASEAAGDAGWDWGSFPDWMLLVVAAVGLWLTLRQLKHLSRERETENILSIFRGTTEHNTGTAQELEQSAIASIEGLSVPADNTQRKTYWAHRKVHLSHLFLVWQVWELAAQKDKRSKNRRHLPESHDGWERFATNVIVRKLSTADKERNALEAAAAPVSPETLAASDLWRGLDTYEPFSSAFVTWLKDLETVEQPESGDTQANSG